MRDLISLQKSYLILLIIPLIFLAVYLLTPTINGTDSYYFINHICFSTEIDAPILSNLIFSLLSCDFTAFKLLLFASLLFCVLIIAFTGRLFSQKYGFLAGFFAFAGTNLPLGILNTFEDDILAYPILFLAQYFFIKGLIKNNLKDKLVGIALVLISLLFWKGSIIYLIPMGLTSLIAFIPLMGTLVVLGSYEFAMVVFPVLFHKVQVLENLPLIAAAVWGFLLIGLIEIKRIKEKPFVSFGLIFIGMALLNAKFAIHAIPFLAIATMLLFERLAESNKIKEGNKAVFLLGMTCFIIVYSATALFQTMPTQDTWNAIDYAIEQSELIGKPVKGDWSIGYFLEFKGLDVNGVKSGVKEQNYSNSIAIVFNEIEVKEFNCMQLKKFDGIKIFDCN